MTDDRLPGPPPPLARVLEVLREERPAARAFGIELVGVVGSVARGEASSGSDVDVVYDVVGRASLFDLGGLLVDLRERFRCEVDLVDRHNMKPERWAYMGRDLVLA